MDFLSTSAVARELKVSYDRLWRLLRDGKITPPERDSSQRYIWRKQDVDRARAALAEKSV